MTAQHILMLCSICTCSGFSGGVAIAIYIQRRSTSGFIRIMRLMDGDGAR